MAFLDPPLSASDALDVKRVPDDKLFSIFLDWAKIRGLIKGYYLVIYNQTGPRQGIQTHVDRLPRNLSENMVNIVDQYIQRYNDNHQIPPGEHTTTDDGKTYIHQTSISRIYDIDLGMLIFITEHRVRQFEIDRFVRFMEANVSIRKQAIASTLNPPFVDLALQEQIQLDHEVAKTVVQAIEANQTHVLSYDDKQGRYLTAYSTVDGKWSVAEDDPVIIGLSRSKGPMYVQDVTTMDWIGSQVPRGQHSGMGRYIQRSGCQSALIFDVKHDAQRFAIIICLFARVRAVSMTEVAIATRLQLSLADYYRLGFERHKAARVSDEAEGVEKKARQALLIADIMHDATDDLLASRNSLDSLTPRNEIERNELENAKKNLKRLHSTALLFRFLFTENQRKELSIEEVMSVGKDYYSDVLISDVYEEVKSKYRRALEQHKITMNIQVPPHFTVKCMSISVSRAIDNCVKNSIRHFRDKTHAKRVITLGARSTLHEGSAMAELWVHDNAVGIEPSWLEKVKRPFVSNSGGMGLGLAIVGTVCDIHDGILDITSEFGSWTRITMYFPQNVGRGKG
jgi:signal transduction histidine kinase